MTLLPYRPNVGAVLFNLICDLAGGVRIVVIEEETARPAAGVGPRAGGTDPVVPDRPPTAWVGGDAGG